MWTEGKRGKIGKKSNKTKYFVDRHIFLLNVVRFYHETQSNFYHSLNKMSLLERQPRIAAGVKHQSPESSINWELFFF